MDARKMAGMQSNPARSGITGLLVLAVASWLLCLVLSFASSQSYRGLMLGALAAATVHFAASFTVLRRSASRSRFILMVASALLGVILLDDLGRLSAALGGPLFRILL